MVDSLIGPGCNWVGLDYSWKDPDCSRMSLAVEDSCSSAVHKVGSRVGSEIAGLKYHSNHRSGRGSKSTHCRLGASGHLDMKSSACYRCFVCES